MIIKSAITRLAFATVGLTAIATLSAAHAQIGYWPPPGPYGYGPPPSAYGYGPHGPLMDLRRVPMVQHREPMPRTASMARRRLDPS